MTLFCIFASYKFATFYKLFLMKKIFTISVIMFSVMIFAGCSDSDLYDQAAYDAILKAGFPVDSVDSTQNWKTVGSADVSVYVNLDYGETYTVKVYKSNPLACSVDTLLASGDVVSGNTLTTTMSYPLAQTEYYVTLVDKDGYMQVKPTTLSNGTLTAFFGEESSASSARMKAPMKANADNYTIPSYETPSVSQYLTGAVELNETNATVWNSDKKIKLTGTWNTTIKNLENWNEASRTLYITGTWTVPKNTTQVLGSPGVIVVANGGKIVLSQNSTLSVNNGGKIYVMDGGSITGEKGSTLYFDGSGTTGYDYNAGTISVSTLNVHGSSFYNVGTISTSSFLNQTSGYPFINWGKLYVTGDMSTYNAPFYNGCYVKCTGSVSVVSMRLGSSSYFRCNEISMNATTTYMGNDAIFDTQYLTIGNSSIYGPTSGDNAIFQFYQFSNNGSNSHWGKNYLYNNLSFCTLWGWVNMFFNNVFTTDGNVTGYGYNQINTSYDASDCSDGYQKDDASSVEDTPQGYTFCFEDNYPSPGDYDFNDVVVSVIPSTSGKKMIMKVTLDAVGATKQLAGAIRLAGIKASDITSLTKNGSTKEETTNLNTTFIARQYITDVKNNRLLSRSSAGEDVVIPLFNDAHYAISGSMDRNFYNTKESDDAETAKTDTLTYTITFKDETTASKLVVDSLDAFVIYSYNSVNWEIHTFPFKTCKVLYDRNEGSSSYYPWAFVVPKPFYYPLEWQPITVKISDTSTTDTGAYSVEGNSFAGWAADKTTNTEWYKHPVTSKVYGYPSSSSSVRRK